MRKFDNLGSAGVRSTPEQGVRSWIDAPELVPAAPLATAAVDGGGATLLPLARPFDDVYITARNP